ncbi:cell wall-binding repeat-containing protein [Clostridium kluyveri]|uniref:Cell surface protein n=1 Tax=Clostridium kluyveri TaxID=1534 RepID=A0A1L5F4B3_CLOKL|nr:cell wall-binding repeat-containing protein [Clostridium kluyveri]APM37849.1 cell surface protein [Clostridium kluyveri]
MKIKKLLVFLITFTMTAAPVTFSTKAASSISRREAQERAYEMAYVTWKYDKSLNGNVTDYIELPGYLKDKTTSEEVGIPYNYGGSDSIGRSSNRLWSNFFDALTKRATAGNVKFEGGYKGETAGIDAASFIQDSLKIPGTKLTTNSISKYLTAIDFNSLTNMDILLSKGKHIAFFQSWVYNDLGEIVGAATLEATIDNDDNTGQKVKEYYRSKDYIVNNFKAYRYSYISDDYIEDNALEPKLEAPLYGQAIDKNCNGINLKWNFDNEDNGQYQTSYRIRIYSGDLNSTSDSSGILVKQVYQDSQAKEAKVYFSDMPEGSYYFILEVKSNKGYWSSPTAAPFEFTSDISKFPSKINSVVRYGGSSRYETSKIIAENEFKNFSLQNIVITNGNDFADGLAGVTLARKLNSPMLLVDNEPSDEGSQITLQYIMKNVGRDAKIYLLGGEGVLSNSYVEYLEKNGYEKNNIVRIGGSNRLETSVNIAKEMDVSKNKPIIIASDSSFADALSVSSKAASDRVPILLTSRDGLSEEVIEYIKDVKPSKVYILGETGVISKSVENNIAQITNLDSSKIIRLGGEDRYITCEKINKYFYGNQWTKVYLANGEDFADSLSGSAAAAVNSGAPLVLVSEYSYGTAGKTIKNLTRNKKVTLNVLGGDKLITEYLISKINNAAVSAEE